MTVRKIGRNGSCFSLGRFRAACCVKISPFPKSVIPACFKRWFDWAHHRRVRTWTPDQNIRGHALGKIRIAFF